MLLLFIIQRSLSTKPNSKLFLIYLYCKGLAELVKYTIHYNIIQQVLIRYTVRRSGCHNIQNYRAATRIIYWISVDVTNWFLFRFHFFCPFYFLFLFRVLATRRWSEKKKRFSNSFGYRAGRSSAARHSPPNPKPFRCTLYYMNTESEKKRRVITRQQVILLLLFLGRCIFFSRGI